MMNKRQRDSNIELMRIVSMLMIIMSHYVYFAVMHANQGTAFEIWKTGSTTLKFLTSCCVLGKIGVGLFFTITGYFTVNRSNSPSLKKILAEVLFYASLSLIIMFFGIVACGYEYGNRSNFVLLVLQTICVPLTGSLWWFVTAYVTLVLFSQTINSFVKELNKKGYLALIVLIGIFGLILGELGSSFHDLEKAVFYYLIGGYFKLYRQDFPKSQIIISTTACIALLLINGVINCNIYTHVDIVILRKSFSMLGIIMEPFLVAGLFLLFINLKIGANAIINRVASFTFGIYLFHEAPYTRELLWNRLFSADDYYSAGGGTFLAYSIMVITMVFAVGSIIDFLRQKFIEENTLNIIDRIEAEFKRRFFKSGQY